MYTLDTNTIIYYLKGDPEVVSAFQDMFGRNVPVYVSSVTEVELFGYPALTTEEAALIETALQAIATIPLDSRIARLAGALRRQYRLKTSDAAIAATALFTGSILLTRNIKDFKKVQNLQLQKI